MRMSTEPENGGLNYLEKELTCSICTEVLYQPLTLLDCLHTFCGSCIKEWFEWQLIKSRDSPNALEPGATPYTCPSCRDPVRSTRRDAKVTTLLDMFIAASPGKARTKEEVEELAKKYTIGDDVLPKVAAREMTLRERRVEDEDRRLMDEVRGMSLREVGVVEGTGERRERRRREEGRSHTSRVQDSRELSREGRESRSGEDRERRRRREAESGQRRTRDNTVLSPESGHPEERRRRRSNEEASRRHEETSRSAARQVEHQSSLRSLINSSDADSTEMEEEILRQIREEGLLDGIDLENIDVSQEDQISERIAEAFKRRQEEKARQERDRRRASDQRRQARGSATPSRETSGDEGRSSRRRTHSRTVSAISQSDATSRPPTSMSATQANHLEIQSGDEGRRRRRTTSSSRSSTGPMPASDIQMRPATRSVTDLSNRPRSADTNPLRPSVTTNSRSNTEPNSQGPVEVSASESTSRETQRPANTSTRIETAARMEESSTLRPLSQSHWPSNETITDSTYGLSLAEVVTPVEQTLIPAPLSPSHSPNRTPPRSPKHSKQSSLSDRATAFSSVTRPTSSSHQQPRQRAPLYPEPSITCARCKKPHIEYELHYNCGVCHAGNYNICMSCFRSGAGCLHWFGFGNSAWTRWEALIHSGELPSNAEKPHMLTANRYLPPITAPGGAEGRRTLTTQDPMKRLQSGVFCANCLSWANECYWRCESCNEGDWGFCNNCVNQHKSCTHALLPLTYKSPDSETPETIPFRGQSMPPSATILTGPGVVDIGRFKPLSFSTTCDICHHKIAPTSTRYHCPECTSKVPNTQPGDYDICMSCYPRLVSSRRISPENGGDGWRRCLEGHRMIIIDFEKNQSGQQRRVIISDLIGGHLLKTEAFPSTIYPDLSKWSWGSANQFSKLVTNNVMNTAPKEAEGLEGREILGWEQAKEFPREGGIGMACLARWSRYPDEGADDELGFPKGAVVGEGRDVNGEWWFGVYMGRRGLFPGGYVRVLSG